MRIKRAPQLTEMTPVRFPVPLTERMDLACDQFGYTRSALIRQAVREWLDAR